MHSTKVHSAEVFLESAKVHSAMPFGFGHGDSAKVNLFGLGQPVALGQDVSASQSHSAKLIRPGHSDSANQSHSARMFRLSYSANRFRVSSFGFGHITRTRPDHSESAKLIRPGHSDSARPFGNRPSILRFGQAIRTRPDHSDSAILFGLGHDTRMLVAVACIHATSPS